MVAGHTDSDPLPDRHAAGRSRIQRLNDPQRLRRQLSEKDLAQVLALDGHEDLLDLGSGTGFYTDRIAALTSGTVHAVELVPELSAHYLERGLPGNVRLISGDITDLPVSPAATGSEFTQANGAALLPASVDVACTIATWHEIEGKLDLLGLMEILRPEGRLVVIDWRRDPDTWEGGPPEAERFAKEEVARSLAPYFPSVVASDLGPVMFVVVGKRGRTV